MLISAVSRSCGSCMFSGSLVMFFLRNCQTIFQHGCTILHSHHRWCQPSSFSPSLAAIAIVTLFLIRGVMIAHCDFNLHFHNCQYCWTSFHMLICQLYHFSGTLSLCFWYQIYSLPRFWRLYHIHICVYMIYIYILFIYMIYIFYVSYIYILLLFFCFTFKSIIHFELLLGMKCQT